MFERLLLQTAAFFWIVAMVDKTDLSLALIFESFSLTIMIAAKIPTIETTIRSSTKVNPDFLENFLSRNIFVFSFLKLTPQKIEYVKINTLYPPYSQLMKE